MSLARQNPKTIPFAHGGPITDQILDSFITAATKAQTAEHLDDAEAALIICLAAPIAQELLQRRRAMALISDVVDLDNVVFLPAG
ncbi:hypothetical protein P775_08305 [Puniceibacterium antarcticum]|uniref:Uncharacterized protein n=1 Tax=Puniceibacterium antarcticum TaxID=1206336 RepID=A0A2G8RGI8_9RHOB|nr:hypothetical protein [Puniceibacterium antarcticum]PIL20521.1 hypothetical protein P775_08305 [Puniceibacterium antarcticum]